jgi:hypothetical protein
MKRYVSQMAEFSAYGTKPTYCMSAVTSAFKGKADIAWPASTSRRLGFTHERRWEGLQRLGFLGVPA